MNLDDHKIDIPCPSCGRKRAETIRKLKTNPKLTCVCGTVIDVDAKQLTAGLKGFEKSIADLERTLRRIGK
ncbi:hypothetical protein X805_04770 [Sphaerotilus natans subsp. natans DSM 6575]|uniref:Uncharacterized protein n=1 Tax=Sphaerotilus natans subsp. natans DSM 6575 TaxID=1286631 RepID=A0A059KS38_9BURK|nr:hypothetical protein [Sphaerotilus natans]KDB53923.1 hypothetical protein X805_04770 [Sphaerotilus natans subsp. natans DSM 6575]SIR68269.1 hypothetical protein SAMN05421778_11481 [Sphaerotilus natans]